LEGDPQGQSGEEADSDHFLCSSCADERV
jgi:hypothetical protein